MKRMKFTRLFLIFLLILTVVNAGIMVKYAFPASQSDCNFCIGFPCLSGGCCCYSGDDDLCYCFAGCFGCGCQYYIGGYGYNEMCPGGWL